ncbi:riboflavin synthase, alpha subunit [Caldalkalibacillus thermarum TA2.A1]|uniref:Riboflavin synthase n=1 Tax=Caldalkalibacillus thermarum (strain TA2.A1) TaxID=986075 RepID=F5L630_CALTT|nr:riboflavin synthase [Caldalkalibacillus thermarum]EGL83184.1 riboflavin synthase, alpha subunit [Caldalkalibacillus thermarum TA2.A1]QZT33152.1 riboflavin synthase [Caldalkalibacillus thermarum TA2.A1]
MFTGIVEEIGTVKGVHKGHEHFQLVIGANKILEDIHTGDSIAVNGVCLTVTNYTRDSFQVDVMPETLKATSLSHVTSGSKVNLERAMPANGRFGGHIVSGHVDGTGTITAITSRGNAVYFTVQTPPELMKYLVPKGSVTVDGISLTVVEVGKNQFSVSIIPHTLSETILHTKQVGDVVNLECDVLAKYLERLLAVRGMFADGSGVAGGQKGLTRETLEKNGYL